MSIIALHIRGIDRDAVSAPINQLDVYVQMTGLLPARPALHAPEERWGRRLFRRKGYRQRFTGEGYPTTVQASGWDFGDYRALEEVLVNRDEVYLVEEGTVFYRSSTTAGTDHNFWTGEGGILHAAPLLVVCTSGPELSPDFDSGTDKFTFTLEVAVPNA